MHVKLKLFDELKYRDNGEEKEYTDVYVRYDNRVFLGEAKSTGIYDKEKYSGDLDHFYRDRREAFFNAFGLKQIVTAIENHLLIPQQFDGGFPRKGTIKVFPAIIVNEKALQTPLTAQVFNNRFKEMVVDMNLNQIKLAPLTIIHISDLEAIRGLL